MELHDIIDQIGRVLAFEVENIGRMQIVQAVESLPGVQMTRRPKWLSELREEDFCDFVFEGHLFRIWEPFGDNSRYWIGPEPARWCEQVEKLRVLFMNLCKLPLA